MAVNTEREKQKKSSMSSVVTGVRAIGRKMSIMVGMSKAPPTVAAPPMMSMSEDGDAKEEDEEEDEEKNPFVLLKDASGSDLVLGILALPISVSLWLFVPDWCVVHDDRDTRACRHLTTTTTTTTTSSPPLLLFRPF